MAKAHTINLTIINNTGYDMTYVDDWFDSGRLADGNSWPTIIQNGHTAGIQCYESDYSLIGCSGYVRYTANNQQMTIAFQNAAIGANTLGFGVDGKTTWNSMSSHNYIPFIESINMFTAFESCTAAEVNNARIRITTHLNFPPSARPKAHAVDLIIFNSCGENLTYSTDWFDSGRVGDNQSWPATIPNNTIAAIQCYEKDFSWAGCSGYVVYTMPSGQYIAIGFSNPLAGANTLGVGTDGRTTYDYMSDHGYQPFTENVTPGMIALCSCTAGAKNIAWVTLVIPLTNWMSTLDDKKPLSSLSIPGTHDSCATWIKNLFSKCQKYGITEQLNLGIRFLDIRCKVINGKLQVYHGIMAQWISFDGVLQEIIPFLNTNSKETIVLCVKDESNGADPDFNTIFFNDYYNSSKYHDYFFAENRIPILKEVRKKIVLIRRFAGDLGIDASNGWKDNSGFFKVTNNAVSLVVQDLYNTPNYANKKIAIETHFYSESSFPGSLLINFISGYMGSPTPNGPEVFANVINPWLNQVLLGMKKQRLGIVAMDFPIYDLDSADNFTEALIPTIIKANF